MNKTGQKPDSANTQLLEAARAWVETISSPVNMWADDNEQAIIAAVLEACPDVDPPPGWRGCVVNVADRLRAHADEVIHNRRSGTDCALLLEAADELDRLEVDQNRWRQAAETIAAVQPIRGFHADESPVVIAEHFYEQAGSGE